MELGYLLFFMLISFQLKYIGYLLGDIRDILKKLK